MSVRDRRAALTCAVYAAVARGGEHPVGSGKLSLAVAAAPQARSTKTTQLRRHIRPMIAERLRDE
jgi:hypothetical protein